MSYVCRAQDNVALSACHEQGLHQCAYCAWYQAGHGDRHYQLPATVELDPSLKHPMKLVDYDRMRMAFISYAGY